MNHTLHLWSKIHKTTNSRNVHSIDGYIKSVRMPLRIFVLRSIRSFKNMALNILLFDLETWYLVGVVVNPNVRR